MKPAAVTLPGPAVLVINYLSIYLYQFQYTDKVCQYESI